MTKPVFLATPQAYALAKNLGGATLKAYLAGTTTPTNMFSDSTLSTSLGPMITADSQGRFPSVFIPNNIDLKLLLEHDSGLSQTYDYAAVSDTTGLAETVRDAIGAALVATGGISITPDDGADTITIGTTAAPAGGVPAANVTVPAIGGVTGHTARALSSRMQDWVSILDFGADRTGATSAHTAFQNAVNAASGAPANSFAHLVIPPGNYRFDAKVTIPDGRRMKWEGLGDARLYTNSSIVMIEHIRGSTANWSRLLLENLWLEKVGGAGSSVGVNWQGPDATYDDSRIETTHCEMRGFWRAVSIGYAGGSFEEGFHADNGSDFYMTRGASFIDISHITSVNGDYFIYADDATGGGISNTVNVLQCVSVFKQVIDVRMRGWDAVKISDGGCDLGGSGNGASQAAIFLDSCTNTDITNQYISSATTGTPNPRDNRVGIDLLNCQSTHIMGNRIVDNAIGVRATGPSGGANTLIQGNTFRNNRLNHVIAVGSAAGRIIGNSFDNTPGRTGTDFEVFLNVAGNTGWAVTNNLFEGASYTITTAGNSNIADNIFSEPLP